MAQEVDKEIFSEEETRNRHNFRQERFYYDYQNMQDNEGNQYEQKQNLVKAFLYINLLKLMNVIYQEKTEDIFGKYMKLMGENLKINDLICRKEVINLTESFEWKFSYEQIQSTNNKYYNVSMC